MGIPEKELWQAGRKGVFPSGLLARTLEKWYCQMKNKRYANSQ